jgi:hypothetical protein
MVSHYDVDCHISLLVELSTFGFSNVDNDMLVFCHSGGVIGRRDRTQRIKGHLQDIELALIPAQKSY